MTSALAEASHSSCPSARNRGKRLLIGPLRSRLFFCILFIILLAFTVESCDESTRPGNHAPVITDIEADPPRITVGDTISLHVTATDADGDSISFIWSADGGQLVDTTGVSVRWVAPSILGEYTLTVWAFDGTDSTVQTKSLSTEGVLFKGDIAGEMTKEYSPYILTGDCTVPIYYILVIHEGVEIRVRGPWQITIRGSIRVLGTEQEPVVITSDSRDPRPGDWRRIRFVDDPNGAPINPHFGNLVRWCVVEYADTGIVVDGAWTAPTIERCLIRYNSDTGIVTGGGLRDDGFNTTIRGCKISDNGILGIRCNAGRPDAGHLGSSDAIVSQCVVTNNGRGSPGGIISGGVYCQYFIGQIDSCVVAGNGANGVGFGVRVDIVPFFPEIHDCAFYGNSAYDLECRDVIDPWDPEGASFDASGNYWGIDATAEMEAGQNPKNIGSILDHYDDARLWRVDYLDWLESEPEIPRGWPHSE